jgi:cytoskeletal protein RodZ
MESIGVKLRQTREERGYSIEQVARDTNIARRYIDALENEDFSVFPGEPYIVGFLRNYADYLGLESEELVGLYRNLKLQEQPAPMEQLLDRKRKIPVLPAVIVLVVLALIAAGVYLIGFSGMLGKEKSGTAGDEAAAAAAPVSPDEQIEHFPLEEEILEKRFSVNDVVFVSLENGDVPITITSVDQTVEMRTAAGDLEFSMDEDRQVDIDGDGEADLRIFVNDILVSDKSAVIRFDRFLKRPLEEGGEGLEETDSTPAVGESSVASRRLEPVTITTASRPNPFQVELSFRGYCLFRYLSDSSQREERYFHKDELFRIDVDREIRLWVSNAGLVTAKITGKEMDLGGAGEVSTKLVRWERSESGNYELKLIPVY